VDYATSSHYLSHLDPFSLKHSRNMALSIPLPTAVSGFVVKHRSSANFFDLLEKVDIWKYVDKFASETEPGLSKVTLSVGGEVRGGRLLGGVPT
jgi:hypothetical protein